MGVVYFSELPDRRLFRASYWLVSIGSVLGASAVLSFPGFPLKGLIGVFLALIFGGFIFLVLGLINLLFKNRNIAYSLLNIALIACFSILVFYRWPGFSAGLVLPDILWLLLVFFGITLLMKEFLVFEGVATGWNLRMISWSVGFLACQIAALSLLLPLGFINAAAFLTLFLIIVRDAILGRLRGFLGLTLVLRELTIFVVVLSLIFATVTWILP
ncbi:MAG: hypothetical protein AAB399_01855 [Patescibacteria group bacterium]